MADLQEERNKLFLDIYGGKKPSRIPISLAMNIEAAIEYFGYSLKREFYSPEKCYEVADKMAELIDSDIIPVSPATTPGAVFRYIGQKFMEPGDDGFFQHPDIAPMKMDEYPEYIKNPFEFIVGTIHPRVFKVFDDEYPELAHLRIRIARQVVAAEYTGMANKIKDKHHRENVIGPCGMSWAPFDFIADYVRSFSTMLVDMKRAPQMVLDACNATLEYEIRQINALPAPAPGKLNEIAIPLHMPPYMSRRDVEKFYWPTFVKLIEAVTGRGFVPNIFFEADWNRHLDLLSDLPNKPIIAKFEDSDYALIAKNVPTRIVYMFSYPQTLLRDASKQECVDEAKRLIDTLSGAGNYIFGPNKRFIRASDINMENFQAVIKCVQEYGRY